MARDGFVDAKQEHGLMVHETRLVSRYRIQVAGCDPQPVALSNVEQHRWLGYYVLRPPQASPGPRDRGSGGQPRLSQSTLELRITRVIGEGVHEDLSLTNYSDRRSRFRLSVEVDGDFADASELLESPRPRGRIHRRWSRRRSGGVLSLDATLRGARSRIRRGIRLAVERASSPPARGPGGFGF